MALLSRCRCGPRPGIISIDTGDAARRFDPTGTLDIRRAFSAELDQRWSKMRRLVIEAIDRNDHLGLHGSTSSISRIGPRVIPAVMPGTDNVKAFQTWIDEALRQIVLGFDGTWTAKYVSQSADRALQRAAELMGREVEADEGRITAISSLAIVELQGIMEAVSQQAIRALTEGHIAKQRPSLVARNVAAVVSRIGRDRSRLMAQTIIIKMFSAASLDAFRSAGVTQVGMIPERIRVVSGQHGKTIARDAKTKEKKKTPKSKAKKKPTAKQLAAILKREAQLQALGEVDVLTAGDNDVCEECEDISNEGPYSIDEAESLIPAHPNCRCAFVPVSDERFAEVDRAA